MHKKHSRKRLESSCKIISTLTWTKSEYRKKALEITNIVDQYNTGMGGEGRQERGGGVGRIVGGGAGSYGEGGRYVGFFFFGGGGGVSYVVGGGGG